ncbi:hypothetical protein RFM99_17210 [Mesorhizobium sp. VK4C]|uniref:hypothetical protein n=1 Tax=Mesorhizobium captivum TaxID=3072319 RepID=UPI002A24969C|nr:hypothetical protein [Mesorhizobium sp. VK4C]MDX8500150.1 hypothetical protein [Mesorhizobium sp. VK4C]
MSTAKFSIGDRNMIAGDISKLSRPQRELLAKRAHESADAIRSSGVDDLAIAYAILERAGKLEEGSVDKYVLSAPLEEGEKKPSIYAIQGGISRRGE